MTTHSTSIPESKEDNIRKAKSVEKIRMMNKFSGMTQEENDQFNNLY